MTLCGYKGDLDLLSVLLDGYPLLQRARWPSLVLPPYATIGSSMSDSFVRSSFCGNAECLEVSADEGRDVIRLRQTQNLSFVITLSKSEWDAFVAGVKNGDFDFD